MGCSVGGLSFLLAEHCKQVLGVDHSHEDIAMALSLRDGGSVSYPVLLEDGKVGSENVLAKNLSLGSSKNASGPGDSRIQNIDFRNADPMSLPAEYNGFDVVVLSDVIDKIAAPNSLLGRLGKS